MISGQDGKDKIYDGGMTPLPSLKRYMTAA